MSPKVVCDPSDGAVNLVTFQEEKLPFLSLEFPTMHSSEIDGQTWRRVPIDRKPHNWSLKGSRQLKAKSPESLYSSRDFTFDANPEPAIRKCAHGVYIPSADRVMGSPYCALCPQFVGHNTDTPGEKLGRGSEAYF